VLAHGFEENGTIVNEIEFGRIHGCRIGA
jgi:hypothetical protein